MLLDLSMSQFFLGGLATFLIGLVMGLLIYRVMWHIDTGELRSQLEEGVVLNRSLQLEIVRLCDDLKKLQERFDEVEAAGRAMQSDLHAALRR